LLFVWWLQTAVEKYVRAAINELHPRFEVERGKVVLLEGLEVRQG
jgi:hypothetical protein